MLSGVIAIDGPAASGKSTVARKVAAEMGWLGVESGALYRLVTWAAIQNGVDPADAPALSRLASEMPVDFYVAEGSVRFRVGGRDVSAELRSEAVNRAVSHVSAAPEVRRQVVAWLRGLTKFGPLVMEGRDIGSAVFPDTALKFYLDASPEERARRRHAELAPDAGVSRRAVGDSISRRDRIDSGRGADPLRVSPGAMVIDSTSLSIDEVVRMIVARCRGATR